MFANLFFGRIDSLSGVIMSLLTLFIPCFFVDVQAYYFLVDTVEIVFFLFVELVVAAVYF